MPWVNFADLPIESPSKDGRNEIVRYLAKKRVRKPRFYADESVPSPIVSSLRSKRYDVETAGDASLMHRSDEDHVAYVRRTGKILLACDRDFLDDRRYPLNACPPIVVIDPGNGSDDHLAQLFEVLDHFRFWPDFLDASCKFDVSRDGWTESLRFTNGETLKERHRVLNGALQVWTD